MCVIVYLPTLLLTLDWQEQEVVYCIIRGLTIQRWNVYVSCLLSYSNLAISIIKKSVRVRCCGQGCQRAMEDFSHFGEVGEPC